MLTVGCMKPAAPLLSLYTGYPHQATGLVTADLVAAALKLSGHAAAAVAIALPAMALSDLAEHEVTPWFLHTLGD